MNKTKSTASDPQESAEAEAMRRLTEAQAQLSVVEDDAAEAARIAVEIHERVSSGDISVAVDDIVRAVPEAERRRAVVPHYRAAVGAAEQALRLARTADLVDRIESGAAGLLTGKQLEELFAPTESELADIFTGIEEKVERAMSARSQAISNLAVTTANGPSYMLPHGQPDSPLQLHKSAGPDRFEVNGVEYRDYLPRGVVKVVIDNALDEVDRRRKTDSATE
jgi:hypothetical protein